jgi:hypothetical protein
MYSDPSRSSGEEPPAAKSVKITKHGSSAADVIAVEELPPWFEGCAARLTLTSGRMHMWDRSSICAVALTAVLLATPAAAQVVDFGKFPDLMGQWSRPAVGNPNNWIRLGGPPPLTPEYQKVWDEIKADLEAGGPGNWPSTFCVHQGMPAMMSIYSPAEFIVMPEVTWILINHNNDMHRRIYTDGRSWPVDAEPTYAGYSLGKWIDEDGDGKYDVLEIETRFLKNPRGYDTTGIPFHADGKTVIKERIYLDKADPNVLWNEITVIDNALTRPYSKKQRAERNPDPHPTWKSDSCSEYNAQVLIGTDNYYLSADGKLMPARKDQPPPDLSYFKRTR